MKTEPTVITSEEVAQRAHGIWEQSGRPDGQATEHWLRAEREPECAGLKFPNVTLG